MTRRNWSRGILSTLLVSIVLIAGGCGDLGDEGTNSSPLLTHPCTGETIGYFDPTTDTLHFDSGFSVARSDIQTTRVRVEDISQIYPRTCRARTKSTEPQVASTLLGALLVESTGDCWNIVEEGPCYATGCSGCCFGGNGTYYCEEECYDYQRSGCN